MCDWRGIVWLTNAELAKIDIAVVNLACGLGLPGLKHIDFELCSRRLDELAKLVRRFTERHMPLLHGGQCDYPHSEPRFRIQAMITCLQRDLGIRYRFDRRDENAVFEPADSFVSGSSREKAAHAVRSLFCTPLSAGDWVIRSSSPLPAATCMCVGMTRS